MITQNIPSFPKFKKFQTEDREEIKHITKKFPPYCEYSLVGLLTWYNIEVAILNDNLILRLPDSFDDHTPAYSVFGTNEIDQTIIKILSRLNKLGHEPKLILVPEPVVTSLKIPKKFICIENRNMFDYIVSTEEMATLRGGHNRTKRQLVILFSKRYPDYRMETIDLKNHEIQEEIKNLYIRWRKNANKPKNFLNFEYRTLVKLYELVDQLDIVSHGLYHKSTLIGFSIVDLVTKPYAIHYYMKTDIRYRGINAIFNKFIGEYLFNKGYLYLNLEADLGLPGLRNTKMLSHPIRFLKKYTFRLAE